MRKNSADITFRPGETFDPDTETLEAIGPYSFIQKRSGNRYTQDSVLLVNFVLEAKGKGVTPPRGVTPFKGSKVIDLGTGTGVMPVLIAAKTAAMDITGVEVLDEYAALAQRNARQSGLSSRIKIVTCDFRHLPAHYPEGAFDVVISNPPYTKAGAGRQSPDLARRVGRSEVMGGLKDLLTVSSHLIGRSGRMFFVFPVSRMDEMLGEMEALNIYPMRILRQDAEPLEEVEAPQGAANGRARIFLIEAGRRAYP